MTVARLQDSLKAKLKVAKSLAKKGHNAKRNQSGRIKVNGCRSILEKLGIDMKTAKKRLAPPAREYSCGKISSRELARKFSKLVKMKKTMSHETARRLHAQLYS